MIIHAVARGPDARRRNRRGRREASRSRPGLLRNHDPEQPGDSFEDQQPVGLLLGEFRGSAGFGIGGTLLRRCLRGRIRGRRTGRATCPRRFGRWASRGSADRPGFHRPALRGHVRRGSGRGGVRSGCLIGAGRLRNGGPHDRCRRVRSVDGTRRRMDGAGSPISAAPSAATRTTSRLRIVLDPSFRSVHSVAPARAPETARFSAAKSSDWVVGSAIPVTSSPASAWKSGPRRPCTGRTFPSTRPGAYLFSASSFCSPRTASSGEPSAMVAGNGSDEFGSAVGSDSPTSPSTSSAGFPAPASPALARIASTRASIAWRPTAPVLPPLILRVSSSNCPASAKRFRSRASK